MSSAFSINFLEPTLDFQMPITFLLVHKNTMCGYSFSQLDRNENFGNKNVGILLKFLRSLLLLTTSCSGRWFQFWSTYTLCNVIIDMTKCAILYDVK